MINFEDFGNPAKSIWLDEFDNHDEHGDVFRLRMDYPEYGAIFKTFAVVLKAKVDKKPTDTSLVIINNGNEVARSKDNEAQTVMHFESQAMLWCPKELPHGVFAAILTENGTVIALSSPVLFWTTLNPSPPALGEKQGETNVRHAPETKNHPLLIPIVLKARAPEGLRVTFVVTSCGRFALLKRTLESFFKSNEYPIDRYIIVEDSGDEAVNKQILEDFGDIADLVTHSKRMGQLYSIDAAYDLVETPFVFHCEDDWTFYKRGNFIEQSLEILQHDRKIFQVHIADSGAHERVFPADETNSGVSFHYVKRQRTLGAFAFHPGLRRMEDFNRLLKPIQQYYTEDHISSQVAWAGFVSAKLPETYCEHDDVLGGSHNSKHMEYFGCNPADWDHMRPALEIISPKSGETLDLHDYSAVVAVEYAVTGIGAPECPTSFYVDNQLVAAEDVPLGPDTISWSVGGFDTGTHNITIIVAEPHNLRSRAVASVIFNVVQSGTNKDVLKSSKSKEDSTDDEAPSAEEGGIEMIEPLDGSSVFYPENARVAAVRLKFRLVNLDSKSSHQSIVFLDGHEVGTYTSDQVDVQFPLDEVVLKSRNKRHTLNILLLQDGVDTGISAHSEFILKPLTKSEL